MVQFPQIQYSQGFWISFTGKIEYGSRNFQYWA